ncbi:RRQRL motif-containing zinc-binding protein [Streptomyces sp. NPDC006446]|uniref:RRQRL motif-containing zinc-binding protein n=1 Tax=Streptomyces sp. NPDC006446 TaxID=3154301 RepID=UPI0033A05E30
MSFSFAKCFGPNGARHGIPTFPWRCAPDGYATLRQVRACAPAVSRSPRRVLRPRYRRGPLVAYLYRIDHAKPVRPMTPAKRAALAKANTARRTCPQCRTDAGYVIPTSLGVCVPCAFPDDEQRAA